MIEKETHYPAHAKDLEVLNKLTALADLTLMPANCEYFLERAKSELLGPMQNVQGTVGNATGTMAATALVNFFRRGKQDEAMFRALDFIPPVHCDM